MPSAGSHQVHFNTLSGSNVTNMTYIEDGHEIEVLEHQHFLVLLPSFVYTLVLMLIGMPGNLIVILVYLFKMANTTSRHFIISLAVCDFINCAFGMPVELALLSNFYTFDYPYLCKISRFSNFFMNNTSSFVLIGIAVDRFRRVCMPLRPNMTVTHSKVMCIVFTIFSCISAVPALFIYGTRTLKMKTSGFSNGSVLVLKTCHINDDIGTFYPLVFNLYLFIGTLTMFFALAIMYALVGRVVCRRTFSDDKHKYKLTMSAPSVMKKGFSSKFIHSLAEHSPIGIRRSQKSPVNGKRQAEVAEPLAAQDRSHSDTSIRRHGGKEIRAGRTTLILSIVTLIFVISFVPFLAIVTMRYVKPQMLRNMNQVQESLYNLTLRSYLLNSAVNPLIYCFLNRQFRMKVKLSIMSVFCCR